MVILLPIAEGFAMAEWGEARSEVGDDPRELKHHCFAILYIYIYIYIYIYMQNNNIDPFFMILKL